MKNHLRILGTRGVPANHGGFETFAEHLALYLVDRDWDVTVYCQEGPVAQDVYETEWKRVRRVHIPIRQAGAAGTILFDWKTTLHACREQGLVLTLGYNTAIFCSLYRAWGHTNIINMDGIEWRRKKWGKMAKAWFYLNERAGCWLGDHLVADHPEIKRHLATRVREDKITTIAYGAATVSDADVEPLHAYGVERRRYAVLVARPEPENSILEVVRAWSRRRRGINLLVIGAYAKESEYQRRVMETASAEVIFAGAVYEPRTLAAIRYHARFYIHGHQVGGTNPSLVEALGAGNAVLAHDNRFNRWVAGVDSALYFSDEDTCDFLIETMVTDDLRILQQTQASRQRHSNHFTWDHVLDKYEALLRSFLPSETRDTVRPSDGLLYLERRLTKPLHIPPTDE
jgi:glycosyltransferase involved in cell wall biosynthesis